MGRGGARGRGRGRGGRGRGRGRGSRSKRGDESDAMSSEGEDNGSQIKRARFPKGHKKRVDSDDDYSAPVQQEEAVPEAPVVEAPTNYANLLSSLRAKRPAILDELDDSDEESNAGSVADDLDIQEDADALEQGVVLELTAEELEHKRLAMGDEFEIVEVGQDGEGSSGEEETEIGELEEGIEAPAVVVEEEEEEAVAFDPHGDEEEDTAARSSEAYASHFEVDVDGGNTDFAAAVELEKERKKANYTLHSASVFGSVHVGDNSSPMNKPLKIRKMVSASQVRSRLRVKHVQGNGGEECLSLSPIQSELFQFLNSYRDVFVPTRTLDTGDELRDAWALHVLNHVMAARARVLRHNARLRAAAEAGRDEDQEYRDQGFSRPRVLVLLPYRSAAAKFVQALGRLLVGESDAKGLRSVRNYGRCVGLFASGAVMIQLYIIFCAHFIILYFSVILS
jgi:U3 small nucleolar RNA-associated protein 25